MQPVRILILGTGGMAAGHAAAFASIDGAKIVAGVDNREEVLRAFCDKHDIEHRFNSLQDALDWGEFDAASNVTPDGAHHETTLALIAARKHVLCEKPLAPNHADALEMSNKAAKAGLVNAVNLSYREVPALQKAAEMVTAGKLGRVRHFEASYLQSWLTQPAWGDWKTEPKWLWRLSTRHGSTGVLGDVGIHILDFATFAANSMPVDVACRLKTYNKAPGNHIGEYPLDANDSFVLHAELQNGAVGTISATRFASGHHNDLRLRLYGDKGGLEVLFEDKASRLNACLEQDLVSANWEEIKTDDVPTIYQRFVAAIQQGRPMSPDFARGAELQHWLDLAANQALQVEHNESGTMSRVP